MKLSELSGGSEAFESKLKLLVKRVDHIPELRTKLQWIAAYGSKDLSVKAKMAFKKVYNQDYEVNGSPDYRKMGEIFRVKDVWRDINESWFLRDLKPIIPRTWKNGRDQQGAQYLAAIAKEGGPGDDSGLQHAFALTVSKLASDGLVEEVGNLVAKHILHELFA